MNDTVILPSATRTSALRYFSCLRLPDILVLQGPPLLGVALAMRDPRFQDLGAPATLLAANLLLVAHIFMLNDWAGLSADRSDPNKAAAVFTARGVGPRQIAGLTAGLLVISLVLFASIAPVTLGLALSIAALSALYSLPQTNWKGRPLLSSTAHLAGGVLHFLLGYSLGGAVDLRGLATAAFFALIFAAGHLTLEIRDREGDAANAIRTNAVVFGQSRTFAASLLLFTLAQALFLVLTFEGVLPRPLATLVALYPIQLHWSLQARREGFTFVGISRLQTRYRALYAVIGLAMVAAVWGVTP